MMQHIFFHKWLIALILSVSVTAGFSHPLRTMIAADSLPKKTSQKVYIVPFQYKQSALYQAFTYKVIDSVVNILLAHDSITLSIEGFAHVDEGTDSICYYLSLNRALVVKEYILGRGVDSSRIASLKGFGNLRSAHLKVEKKIIEYNCRVEMILNYPLPPPPLAFSDLDEDGIPDAEDGCPTQYGSKINNGCPDKNAIIIPFENGQAFLSGATYAVLDSVIKVLVANPSFTFVIAGHAYKNEGSAAACLSLANERATITKNYLLSRNISPFRIDIIKNFGSSQPITAGKNFWEITRNSRAEIFLVTH